LSTSRGRYGFGEDGRCGLGERGGVASRRGWLREGSGATALSEEGASCLRHLVDICDIWVHVGARGHDVVMRALDRVVIRAVDRCVIGVLSAENPDNATVERKEQGSGEAKERGNGNVRERRAGETRERGESGGPLSSVALGLVASVGARTATSATSTSVALVASTSTSVASASTSVPLATSAVTLARLVEHQVHVRDPPALSVPGHGGLQLPGDRVQLMRQKSGVIDQHACRLGEVRVDSSCGRRLPLALEAGLLDLELPVDQVSALLVQHLGIV